jgi:mRNA interferase HicA
VKKRDLEKILKKLGCWKLREGLNHEIWTNGDLIIPVPRHKEINEKLAKYIIRNFKECSYDLKR